MGVLRGQLQGKGLGAEGGAGSQQDSLSWSAVQIRTAKNSDLVSHTLSFKVVDLYMINYHFWQLKMHGGKKKKKKGAYLIMKQRID